MEPDVPRQGVPLQRSLSSTLLADTVGLVLNAVTAGKGLGRVVVVGTVVVVWGPPPRSGPR
jgi:hypothetical protein